MLITRRLEFDAGHRIPDHQSQCKHLHGHRYVLELTVEGPIINASGRPDNGMVLDFSDVKQIAKECVVDPWDHAFLCWREDTPIADFLASIPGHKTVLLDVVPTAENLALLAFTTLDHALRTRYGSSLRLSSVRLYETPNCWADIHRDSYVQATP
jgi:6-pyruvoyltetrahydropterin/6-carboxytetrahydropterin synthase